MKKTLLKIFAVCLCLCMVIPAFASCGKKNDKFVIGVSGPLTGEAAVYGVAVKNSAQMAVDEINAAGGLNGVQFELIAADDKARRARGYMKGPASALVNQGTQTLRQAHNAARIILGTFTLSDGDHWIRFKNTEESLTTEFMHNYLELVPKSVISDPSNPEDIN